MKRNTTEAAKPRDGLCETQTDATSKTLVQSLEPRSSPRLPVALWPVGRSGVVDEVQIQTTGYEAALAMPQALCGAFLPLCFLGIFSILM